MTGLGRTLRLALFLVPLLFLFAFFFYPLANILRLSLSTAAIAELVGKPYYLGTLWFTVWQAVASTAATLLIGLPAAWLFARFQFRGRTIFRALVTVPFVLPTVVVATAFRALLGPGGPVNELLMNLLGLERAPVRLEQTIFIILLAHIFYNVAVVVRLVGGYWANLGKSSAEAATVLGASPLRAFWEVTLPLLRPALISASLLIFLFTFTSFGVILILGGPAFSTLETEIYRQHVTFLRADIAGVLSLLQVILTFTMMSVYAHIQRRTAVAVELRPRRQNLRRPHGRGERLIVGFLLLALSLFMLSPLVALAARSLVNGAGQLSLVNYESLPVLRRGSVTFVPPLTAVVNSIGYALLTMVSALLLGVISTFILVNPGRRRAWLEPLMMLPLGASAVTLGFGYVVTLKALRTSPLLVLIAHTLVALPFVVRSLLPVLQGIRPSLREAAALLGASPVRRWIEVDLPIVGRAMLVAAVFAFTVSMGEFGATSFMVRPNSGYLTLPVAIQRYLTQPGALNFGQAVAMSTILMAVTAAGFMAIERFRFADVGEF